MFDHTLPVSPRPLRLLKHSAYVLLSIYLVIGLMAAYRAWFQVASLDLRLTGFGSVIVPRDSRKLSVAGVQSGSIIETNVVSYARTPVTVRLELIQGPHRETLAEQVVPDNEWAFFDPRSRQASQSTTLTADILSRFDKGRAQLRATAVGREQWTRVPPPVVNEV